LKPVIKLFLTAFIISFLYAILRYVIFGNVDAVHIPLYILNKAMALTGFFLLLVSSLSSFFDGKPYYWFKVISANKDITGIGSFLFIIGHIFMSILIMNPSYFEKFYIENAEMNLTGEGSMLFGVIALIFMWLANRYFSFTVISSQKNSNRFEFKKLIHWGVIFSTLHVIIMGIASWIKPSGWYGYLPPITLIAFCGFILWSVIMIGLKKQKKII
jgi:hypothetical protein